LRKKLKRLQTEGSLGERFSVSRQIPRGQWEKRLQTDIQMAKRALSEALSPEKASGSNSNPSESSSSLSSTKPSQSLCYASSAENIARMLKGWMKSPPKSSRTNSSVTQNSFNNLVAAGADTASSGAKGLNSVELSEDFESLFGFHQFLESSNSDQVSQSFSPDATVLQDESKPDTGAEILPFSLLEKWLLDEAACQEKVGSGDA